jgi:hypothetical protein
MFFKKSPYEVDNDGLTRKKERKPVTKEAKRTALLLLCNTTLGLAIYFGCIAAGLPWIMFVYAGLAAVLLIGYVIYNQGFVLRGVTPEMLDDQLPLEERESMIARAAARYEASRWIMTLIIPLVVAVLVDALYIYLLSDLIALLMPA